MKAMAATCIALAALLPLLIPGCGRKTRPVPPMIRTPAPITDLRHSMTADGITLTWSIPQATEDGTPLASIEAYELQQASVEESRYCPDCPVRFERPQLLGGQALRRDTVANTMTYRIEGLRARHHYFFKVRSRTGWQATSRDSNTVSLLWDIPAMAPENLRIQPGDGQLTLNWQPPQTLADETPLTEPVSYQLYRSTDCLEFTPHGDQLQSTTFTDSGLANDTRYFYRIQALRLTDAGQIGGLLSDNRAAAPRDLTPPPTPTLFTLVKTTAGIKILWGMEPVADLEGFRIYRRLPATEQPALIGEVDATTLMFIDTEPPNNATSWHYSLTAFDRAEPANESPYSQEKTFSTPD